MATFFWCYGCHLFKITDPDINVKYCDDCSSVFDLYYDGVKFDGTFAEYLALIEQGGTDADRI